MDATIADVSHAKDDPAHREVSGWAGRGAEALGLSGPVEPEAFQAVLEGFGAGRAPTRASVCRRNILRVRRNTGSRWWS